MTEAVPAKPRLREVDALRGIAAFGVVLFHLTSAYNQLFAAAPDFPVNFPIGEKGVLLFFAISGFVILLTLNQTRTAGDFLVARFARLFPAFWACLLMTALTVNLVPTGSVDAPLGRVLINLTMIPAALGAKAIDPSYWTLSVELLFYAAMLILWRLRWLGHVEYFLMAWISLRLLSLAAPDPSHMISDKSSLAYIPYFAVGVGSYRVWAKERRWSEQVPLFAVALGTLLAFGEWAEAILWVSILLIFVALVYGRLDWLRNRLLLWLGQISYPLYLLHQFIGCTIMVKLTAVGMPVEGAFLVALATVLALATCVTAWIEQPAMLAIRNAWRTRRQAHNPSSQAQISC